MELNERLLEEKRELLYKIGGVEEIGNKGMMTGATTQHKVNLIKVHSRQLQDQILKLSNQIICSEHTLRYTQIFYRLDDARKLLHKHELCSGRRRRNVVVYTFFTE